MSDGAAAAAAPPPAARRRRQNRDAEVLDAAIAVFCDRGYAAATLQDVAQTVGMLKGSLYYYFDSKESLLFRILSDADEQVDVIFDEVLGLDVAPAERLRRFLLRHIQWYLDNLELARVTFHEWNNLTGDLLATQKQRRRKYDGFVQDLIRACQADGAVSADLPVTLAANYLLGAINSTPDWYDRKGRATPVDLAALYTELTMAMLTNWQPGRSPTTTAARARRARSSR
jgi:AcrR family transcriptional regulator